jgi:alpha-mannosidase
MFRICLDVPKGVDEITLPNDEHVVVFAATLANDAADAIAASPLFKTSILSAAHNMASSPQPQINLLRNAKITAVSGEVNNSERADLLMDGDPNTKWCDAQAAPNYVTFDFGNLPPSVDGAC